MTDVCTACGAPVRTVLTEGAKVRDLEPDAHDDGNHVIVTRDDGTIRARILTGPAMPAPAGAGYRIHRCPPRPPARPGPACSVCLQPMDRALAELERWVTHPSCDPSDRAATARRAARTRRK